MPAPPGTMSKGLAAASVGGGVAVGTGVDAAAVTVIVRTAVSHTARSVRAADPVRDPIDAGDTLVRAV